MKNPFSFFHHHKNKWKNYSSDYFITRGGDASLSAAFFKRELQKICSHAVKHTRSNTNLYNR